jgi:hypothetical protein
VGFTGATASVPGSLLPWLSFCFTHVTILGMLFFSC